MAEDRNGTTIQIRGGWAADWVIKNPVLEIRELGYELDEPNLHKLGDGVTPWNSLPYAGGGGGGDDSVAVAMIQAHINSATPHSVYDNGPSLALLYENSKVG